MVLVTGVSLANARSDRIFCQDYLRSGVARGAGGQMSPGATHKGAPDDGVKKLAKQHKSPEVPQTQKSDTVNKTYMYYLNHAYAILN